MRIVVIGTGGVGGYFGARLTEAGENVTFVARGAHLEAIKSRGLTVYSALGDMHLRDVQCTENTRDIGHADIVMIAVKLWATDEAIQTAKPLLGKNTGIISFQNGILAEESLIAAYSSQHAMGGVANIAALIEEPGVIRHNGNMATDDINRAIWEKYIRLVTMSAMTTLCRMPIGPIRDEVHTRNLLSQILAEIIDVGKAKGLKFSDNVLQEQLDIIDGYPPSMVASMCGDLRRGYPLEVPWFSGTIVRLGKELNIPTPANGFVYAALKLFEHGRPIEAQI